MATVSTGAPLTIGNFLGLAAETETLSEWATKHSYVFIWLLYLLGRCCNWLSWSATTPTSRKAAAILGLVGFVRTFLGTVLVLGAVWASSSSLRFWRSELPEPSISSPQDRWRRGSAIVDAPGCWLVAVRDSRAESTGLPASSHYDTYHRGHRWFSTLASHGART